MAKETQSNQWENWAVFGTRWGVLVLVALATYFIQSKDTPITDYLPFIVGFAAVGVASLLTLAFMYIKSAANALPFVIMVGDWITAGAVTYLSGGDPNLVAGAAGALALSGMLRLGSMWGAFHVSGIIAVVSVVLAVAFNFFDQNINMTAYLPSALAFVVVVFAIGLWVYLRDENVSGHQRNFNDISRKKEAEIEDMRERTRAFSEMATTISSTLNYYKILDAALDVARLSLRKDSKHRIISLVLLFENEEDRLHIANSRGLTRTDENRTFSSKQGLIGKTLEECIPIIGKDPKKDAELSQLIAFGSIRSMLCVPLRAGFDNYGVLLYGCDAPDAFSPDHIETLNAIGIQTTIALQNAVLYRNLMDEKERIIEMEENARKSLVRDLHDVPTQTVSAVAMRIRIIQKLFERGQNSEVMAELKMVEEMTLRATEEIRHVLFKLRPLALESQGLSAALDQLAEKLQKTYKQAVTVKCQPEVERLLDSHAQGVVFYLIEEAVNNARKYAQAKMINVLIGRKSSDVIMVKIADNGVGFDSAAVNANYDQRGSFGMVNMRERAELLDGTLSVESAPGRGTSITVLIPIPGARADNAMDDGAIASTKLGLTANSRANGGRR